MTWNYKYDDLLERAYSQLPKVVEAKERFTMPRPEIMIEGKTTIIRNFRELCDRINRKPEDVMAYLLRELGTSGSLSGDRLILQGVIEQNRIIDAIESYVLSYVICSECGSPDTEIIRQGRNLMLKCHACGAIRPVGISRVKMRGALKAFSFILREGGEYEVQIEGVTREGHGIASFGDYRIIVPRAKKGEKVIVRIHRIIKNVAYAEVVKKVHKS